MEKDRKKHMLLKLLIIVLVFLLIVLYAIFFGTKGLEVKEYKVVNTNLPISYYGLKIVHFSDLHYGRTIHEKELKKLIEKINLTKPDIVVFTGDLIDKDSILTEETKTILEENLKNINSTYGNYYVKGNHDIYFNTFDLIMSNSNFIDLNNNYDIITNKLHDKIFIGGTHTFDDKKPELNIIDEHLESNEYDYKIFLLHMPDSIKYLANEYDLILAGHSHNGQVRLPLFGALIRAPGAKKYYGEYYRVKDMDLYISSGLGTSNINIRFFNKPSFNLYRIVNK